MPITNKPYIIFANTKKGVRYFFRNRVKAVSGEVGEWSTWAYKDAGDTNAPDALVSGNIQIDAQDNQGIHYSVKSSYSRPSDFKEFRWFLFRRASGAATTSWSDSYFTDTFFTGSSLTFRAQYEKDYVWDIFCVAVDIAFNFTSPSSPVATGVRAVQPSAPTSSFEISETEGGTYQPYDGKWKDWSNIWITISETSNGGNTESEYAIRNPGETSYGAFQTYSVPFLLTGSGEGVYGFKYRSRDTDYYEFEETVSEHDLYLDGTAPTFSPGALGTAGGAGYVNIIWTDNPADTASGVRHINIWRNTVDNSSTANFVGKALPTVVSFRDSQVNASGGTTYYYWGEPEDVAGNVGSKVALGNAAPSKFDGAANIIADSITGNEISAATTITAGTGNNVGVLDGADGTWRIYAGHATPASAPFRVDQTGALTATSATITGSITATTGAVGGWTIGATTLTGGNLTLDSGNTKITAGTGNDIVAIDAADATYRLAIGHGTYASAPFRVSKAGAVTATSGVIGGWTLAAGSLSSGSTNITLDSSNKKIYVNSGTFGNAGIQLDYNGGTPRAYIGDGSTKYFQFDGTDATINGSVITAIASGSEVAIQGWQNTCVFSATDYNTVAWASGTITLMDGTAYSISGNNTGNISALTYIYLDIGTSTTELQTTTTAANAVGSGKILIATAEDNDDNTSDATFQVFGGAGGLLLTTENLAASTVTANEILANTITTNEISTNTLTGAEFTATAKITAGTGNNVGILDGADGTYRIYAGHATAASAPFRVTQAGVLTATSATITGSITATTGAVGGWTIGATTLTGGNLTLDSGNTKITAGTSNDIIAIDAADATYRLAIGHATYASAPFRVSKAGAVTATSGTIGGWTIGATSLSSGAANITLDSSGKKIYINSGTFGDAGVQIDYNGGTPRFYVGDGSNKSFQFDGANATLNGGIITNIASGSEVALQEWQNTCVFSATGL